MNEEQNTILRMLSEGKITAEEAEQLMETLGEPTPAAEPKTRIPAEEATEEATEERPAPPRRVGRRSDRRSPRRGPDIQTKIEAKVAAKMEKAREKMARKQEKMHRKMEAMGHKMERTGFRPPKLPSGIDEMLKKVFGKGGRHEIGMDEMLKEMFGEEVAENVRIQYGGSMKPENAGALLAQRNIDGGLIGGASLKADSFSAIVKAAL